MLSPRCTSTFGSLTCLRWSWSLWVLMGSSMPGDNLRYCCDSTKLCEGGFLFEFDNSGEQPMQLFTHDMLFTWQQWIFFFLFPRCFNFQLGHHIQCTMLCSNSVRWQGKERVAGEGVKIGSAVAAIKQMLLELQIDITNLNLSYPKAFQTFLCFI